MKKKSVKKKYPSIRKNSTFKTLWEYYRRLQKDFLKAVRRHTETKKAYEKIKADKNASKAQIKAWKAELKNAKASKQMMLEIVKDARRHIKRWLKVYNTLHDLADNRSSLKPEKKAAPKKKTAPKKAAKAPKAKKKSTPKEIVKATPKPKAAPAKPKLVVAKKITIAKSVTPKPAAPKPTAPVKKAAPKSTTQTTRKTTARKPASTTTRRAPARRTSSRPDNLKRVEGIGVKIEQLLRNAGIDSFEKLSKATKTVLRKLLDEAGPHYRVSDPSTWARQARMAAQGKFEELKKWQAELKGGREVK